MVLKTSVRKCMYMDNYYISPELFLSLYNKGVNACGTARSNRKYYPNDLKVDKSVSILEKWFPFQCERAHSLLFLYMLIERRRRRGRLNNNNSLPKVEHSSQTTSIPPHPNLYHTQ